MAAKKHTLSVVLATFNEEKNILPCLDSVKGLADEVIVVDESSTDSTRQLAKNWGARVFKVRHEPIFHVTKNKAIRKAVSDWVLQLDADEKLTPELHREIDDLLKGRYFGYDSWISPLKKRFLRLFPPPKLLTAPAAAYWLPRRNFFLKGYLKHAGQYPDPVIRLFQNGRAILPAKDVHEQMKVDGLVGWMTGDLDHLSTPYFARYLKRENAYSSLHARELLSQGVTPSFFNHLKFLIIKPVVTFITMYFRYRGFLDGYPGFVFCLFSALHHPLSYLKMSKLAHEPQN